MFSRICSSLSLPNALLLVLVTVPVASARPAPENLVIPDWQAEGDQAAAIFGDGVSGAGDVNGDGYDDILVDARAQNLAGVSQGRVYLYAGSATGLDPTAASVIDGAQDREEFGYSVDSAGDVNGDGFDDILVGGHGYDDPELNEGRAVVYLGSASLAGVAPPTGAPRALPRDPLRVPHAPR